MITEKKWNRPKGGCENSGSGDDWFPVWFCSLQTMANDRNATIVGRKHKLET